MAINNSAHIGQTHPGTFELRGAVKTLEHAEKLVRVTHVKSDSVVGDAEDVLRGLTFGTDFYASQFSSARVFEGIAQKIHHDLAEKPGVGVNLRQIV